MVGGKNASLGEMISNLHASGIRVPNGFATTAKAFNEFLIYNDLVGKIDQKLKNLDVENIPKLTSTGAEIRDWINKASFQVEFEKEIRDAFDVLDEKQGHPLLLGLRQLRRTYHKHHLQDNRKLF